MISNFIPATDAGLLSELSAKALRTNGELLGEILQTFPPEKLAALDRLLAGGGSVGVETLVNAKSENTIRVVGQEREGSRLVLATVALPQLPSAQH